jgi:hypothetical protein
VRHEDKSEVRKQKMDPGKTHHSFKILHCEEQEGKRKTKSRPGKCRGKKEHCLRIRNALQTSERKGLGEIKRVKNTEEEVTASHHMEKDQT